MEMPKKQEAVVAHIASYPSHAALPVGAGQHQLKCVEFKPKSRLESKRVLMKVRARVSLTADDGDQA